MNDKSNAVNTFHQYVAAVLRAPCVKGLQGGTIIAATYC